MRKEILSGLERIAHERDVKVLFACESGSRAWGTESDDSDYDVRFIYVSSIHDYVSLTESRDVIEIMDEELNIDYVGWDLRKALNLLRKGNPSIIEWVRSPIRYVDVDGFAWNLEALGLDEVNLRSLAFHYMGLLHKQYKAYWTKEEIPFKKYFYAIRPILAIEFIVTYRDIPPINFGELVQSSNMPEEILPEFRELRRMKPITTEINGKGRFENLDRWIGKKCDEMPDFIKTNLANYSVPSVDTRAFDKFFRNVIFNNR
jgi:predicted nucleotidyltransferase